MSIEMDNPKTTLEKADAAANLIEQMMLAHMTKDEKRFKEAHQKASSLMFHLTQELESIDESLFETIWDKHSELIGDDLFSMETVAGSSIMRRADFMSACTELLNSEQGSTSERGKERSVKNRNPTK